MKTWFFARNPFFTPTEGSFKNALTISVHHENALNSAKGDPAILALYNVYHPLHVAYQAKFKEWTTQVGKQQGDTSSLSRLLHELSNSKIKEWDIKIQNVYLQGTDKYKGILPYRRGPFQEGTQDERINAVSSLSAAIGSDEALAPVKTDVDAFYTEVEDIRNKQKTSISLTRTISNQLEVARVAICRGQFINLGALIQKYPDSPEIIETFFDLKTIRNSDQTEFRGSVDPEESKTIVKHTFIEDDEIVLENTGTTQLKFYLVDNKDTVSGTVFVQMGKGKRTVLASTLGSLENTFLKVENVDAIYEGSYTIKLL